MRESWLVQPERGSKSLMRLLTWITLRLGRPIGRLLLYPICLYFVAFSKGGCHASRRYLERVLERPAGLREVFRQYYAFASTVHDRVYLLSGRHRYFDIHIEGAGIVETLLERGHGCLLLGSHLGSFEILRVHGLFERKLPITVLMHEGATSKLNSVLHGLRPDIRSHIIAPGAPETMLAVKERLDQGGLVGMLGDRIVGDEPAVVCRFLGEDVLFPVSALRVAALLKVPVVLFFGLYRGGRRYDIHFELLADIITMDRHRRSEDSRPWVQRYVSRLEYYCRLAPYNWFNFYDFFSPDSRDDSKKPINKAAGDANIAGVSSGRTA